MAGLYRVWNTQYRSWSIFGQDHVARVLGLLPPGEVVPHDAAGDAYRSMALLHAWQGMEAGPPEAKAAFQQTLLSTPPLPSFAQSSPVFEGVCMGGRKTCVCGAQFIY